MSEKLAKLVRRATTQTLERSGMSATERALMMAFIVASAAGSDAIPGVTVTITDEVALLAHLRKLGGIQ